MNIRSIHVRLIFWYTVLIICASVGFGAYTYYSLREHLYEDMHLTLARRVEHIRDEIMPQYNGTNPEILKQHIEQVYSPEESNRFIRITETGGSVIYVSGTPQDHSFDPASILPAANYAGRVCGRTIQSGGSGHLLIVGCGVASGNTGYMIEMGAPITEIDGILRKLIFTLLIGLPAVAFITIIGGSFLVRRALQPVEAIRATAEQITFSNLRQRLPTPATGDAIEHLSRTLNQMLERLDQAYQQASRFSADASHELRTPLAIMRSEMESLIHGPNSDVVRERLGSMLEEAERLSGIVEGLFSIARLDAGEAKMGDDAVDLASLVRSTLDQMQLMADEKHLSVTVHAPQPVIARGDAARLKQIVVNLFDNAIKYTMAGGAITFSVQAKSSKAALSVKDNGIGIPPDALPHVFERFYRADKVRSRASQGAGLGLSIVRAICQAHGGTVEIQSKEGSGTIVTIELPLVNSISGDNAHAAA